MKQLKHIILTMCMWANRVLNGASVLTSNSQRATLRRIAKLRLKRKTGVRLLEIGSWMGASAVVLGDVARAHNGKLVCVDWWNGNVGEGLTWEAKLHDAYARFWHRIKRAGLTDTVIPMRGKSQDVLPLLADKSFDVIWIDGDHRYDGVKYDIEQAKRLITSGGLICGHDYEATHSDVVRAVDEIFPKRKHDGAVWWIYV